MKISLRVISFWLFLALSTLPLAFISTIGVTKVFRQLGNIEQGYQELLLEQHVAPLESQIKIYKELIRFVSQLPAVVELLDRGATRPGSIKKDRAYARYTGVINRAFENYPEIIQIHILDSSGSERLHIQKDENHKFISFSDPEQEKHLDQDSFHKALALGKLETITHTKVSFSPGDSPQHHLVLQLYTPVRFNGDNIGVNVSEIDVGKLSQVYPDIQWVFNDGSSLSGQKDPLPPFEKHPGLHEIFIKGEPGITGLSRKFSWVPVFRDRETNISLWAGREISLANTGKATRRFFQNVLICTAIFILLILLGAYFLSNKIQVFFLDLLSWLNASIAGRGKTVRHGRTGIVEVDEFICQLEGLMARQKKFEKQLSDAANEWQTTFDATDSAICLLDQDNRIIRANQKAASLFDFPSDAIIGRHCWEVVHKTDKPVPECTLCEKNADLTRRVSEIQIHDAWYEILTDPVINQEGGFEKTVRIFNDITERKQAEAEKEKLIKELRTALDEIKTLSGLIPICSSCKKIRDDNGYWNQLELYIEKYSHASFSHGMCPECSDRLYGKEDWYIEMKKKEAARERCPE